MIFQVTRKKISSNRIHLSPFSQMAQAVFQYKYLILISNQLILKYYVRIISKMFSFFEFYYFVLKYKKMHQNNEYFNISARNLRKGEVSYDFNLHDHPILPVNIPDGKSDNQMGKLVPIDIVRNHEKESRRQGYIYNL